MKSVCLLFIILLSFFSVSGQEVTSFTGFWKTEYYQDDKEITRKEFSALMETNSLVNKHWRKSKTNETLAGITLLAQVGFSVWMASELIRDEPFLTNRDRVQNALTPSIGVITTGIAGGIFLHLFSKSKKKAILTYNKQFDNKTTYNLVPISNQNGLGLAIRF